MVGATCVPLVNMEPEKPPKDVQTARVDPGRSHVGTDQCCEGSEELSRDEDFPAPEVTGHFAEDPSLDLQAQTLPMNEQ